MTPMLKIVEYNYLQLTKNKNLKTITTQTEPTLNQAGAGGGNRTLVTSLEGWGSTIELHPPKIYYLPFFNQQLHLSYGGGGRIRTSVDVRRQIYSLLPLTTRPPLQICT